MKVAAQSRSRNPETAMTHFKAMIGLFASLAAFATAIPTSMLRPNMLPDPAFAQPTLGWRVVGNAEHQGLELPSADALCGSGCRRGSPAMGCDPRHQRNRL
jgi:hypothetical protein